MNVFLKDIKGVAIQINSARSDRIKLLYNFIFKNDSGGERIVKSYAYLQDSILRNKKINLKLDEHKF